MNIYLGQSGDICEDFSSRKICACIFDVLFPFMSIPREWTSSPSSPEGLAHKFLVLSTCSLYRFGTVVKSV